MNKTPALTTAKHAAAVKAFNTVYNNAVKVSVKVTVAQQNLATASANFAQSQAGINAATSNLAIAVPI
jgi:hypothetical protein